MQSFVYFLMIFAMNLAVDVSVYNATSFSEIGPNTALTKPVHCFSFGYHLNNKLNLRIYFTNKPPSLTAIKAIYQSGKTTVKKLMNVENGTGTKQFNMKHVLNCTEVTISLTLYKSHRSCSPIIVAEGREASSARDGITKKTYRDEHICVKQNRPCTLLVDLEHGTCEDTIVTERNMQTTTARMVTDFKNLNNTFIVPTSSHENLETTTNQTTGNDTSAKSTNNIFIIVGSLSGVTFTLLAIIAIRKRCWVKPSPRGTADLPTNQSYQPFYVNLLFRRECALEIAELDGHVYEEINPPVSEDQPIYEEINPQVTESD